MDYVWPFFFPLAGLAIALVHIRWKQYQGPRVTETILMWQLAIGLGLSLAYGGLGHLLIPDQVAESIGWPVGSPFQTEVGLWDLSLGIVGLLCLKIRGTFWQAAIIGPGIFLFGAGVGHVYQMVVHGDYSPNNAGGVMYVDLLLPIALAALYLYWHRQAGIVAGSG